MKIAKIIIIALNVCLTAAAAAGIFYLIKNTNKETYTVRFDTDGGTPVQTITVKEGDLLEEPVSYKLGYYVYQWNSDSRTKWNFAGDRVKGDMKLTAQWTVMNYSIYYNLNGGMFKDTFPTTYTIEDELELTVPYKDEAIFGGWFNLQGERIDKILPGSNGNVLFEANWITNVKAVSLDLTRGKAEVRSADRNSEYLTLYNIPENNKFHLFKGWYDNNNILLSTDHVYSFKNDKTKDIIIYAKYMSDEEENEWNLNHGVIPKLVDSNNKIYTYGMYPQSNINDEELINKIQSFPIATGNNIYYYNHEYYTPVIASLARDSSGELLPIRNFDNGDEIIESNLYWFKIEPIRWKAIQEDNSNLMLLSEMALDITSFNYVTSNRIIDGEIIYPNNYKYSSVREWLNNTFINYAFSYNDSYINITHIDNSPSTTINPEEIVDCGDTDDKVYLLSYKDYITPEYGFSPDPADKTTRNVKSTDYIRATRCYYSTDEEFMYMTNVYTRSAYCEESGNNKLSISKVNRLGMLNEAGVNNGQIAVQPALNITL